MKKLNAFHAFSVVFAIFSAFDIYFVVSDFKNNLLCLPIAVYFAVRSYQVFLDAQDIS